MQFDLRKLIVRAAALWVVIAVPVTILSALVYVAVQQNFRQNANDPQVQMAEDASVALAGGKDPGSVVPGPKVEMSQSLAPWLMVLDDRGEVLASSAVLDGQTPRIPRGVLDHARTDGENRVSWQPRPGVRSALVVRRYEGVHPGFAASGRSLREVEVRESQLTSEVGGAWLVALAASGIVCLVVLFLVTAIQRTPQE